MAYNGIDARRWASRKDTLVDPKEVGLEDQDQISGHDRSPDAIGGYFGIEWYELFRDRKTGGLYQVRCYDGVNSSKGAYDEASEEAARKLSEAVKPRRDDPPGKFSGVMADLLKDYKCK